MMYSVQNAISLALFGSYSNTLLYNLYVIDTMHSQVKESTQKGAAIIAI